VVAAVRFPERFGSFEAIGVRLCGLTPGELPQGTALVHAVPPLDEPVNSAIRSIILASAPRRVVYISSTGVYGSQTEVSAESPAMPADEKGRARVAEEVCLLGGSWSSLILRSAAIYGPHRGIHVRLREGRRPRGAGGVVSRIHVDDLVRHVDAALSSEAEGAWPVADECAAASEEVAVWCAKLMGISMPDTTAPAFPVSGRSVDGSKIRELLGIKLKYASYKEGLPASLAEESR
jgi:nucleoside-diphosphate-sugar epimerase